MTAVLTALPTITSDLGGLNELSWVVTAYLLTATASTPIWGKLSDLYGRKLMLQISVVVFVVASALAGLSQNMAELIATRSPIALSVTLTAVRRAGHLRTLEEVLQQEFRVSVASAKSHDFVEGIRAQLVDKDRNPQWSPATLAECDDAAIDAYFASAEPDLTF